VGCRVRAEGAQDDRRDLRRVHPPARRPADRRLDRRGRANAAADAGRDPADVTICVAAPAYVGTDIEHMRDQCRWFGGMVGNHVADIVDALRRPGRRPVPQALTDYIKGREGYDYNQHGQAGNTHAQFVPDEIVDRFCILG
jgi:cytochrome P450